jgi:hypothetical protein
MPIDVDDVDGTIDGTQRALDAPVLVQAEHPPETVRRFHSHLRILDRHLLLPNMPKGDPQTREQVQQHDFFQELFDLGHISRGPLPDR